MKANSQQTHILNVATKLGFSEEYLRSLHFFAVKHLIKQRLMDKCVQVNTRLDILRIASLYKQFPPFPLTFPAYFTDLSIFEHIKAFTKAHRNTL